MISISPKCHIWIASAVVSFVWLTRSFSGPLQARVLATIGVTRGLGDHNLKVHDSNIYIKPFLSCCPEVGSTLNVVLNHSVYRQIPIILHTYYNQEWQYLS